MLKTVPILNDPMIVPVVDHLHITSEQERVALARTIHDEIGGLLVAASMDLAWAESHSTDQAVVTKLKRVRSSISSAIDIKRRLIERLRPTLLDNMGLFAALRWYFKHCCHHAEAACSDTLPLEESNFSAVALSQIFRAIQTLLDCTFDEMNLNRVTLVATVAHEELAICVSHEHSVPESVNVMTRYHPELCDAAYRLSSVRGHLRYEEHASGAAYHLNVPISR